MKNNKVQERQRTFYGVRARYYDDGTMEKEKIERATKKGKPHDTIKRLKAYDEYTEWFESEQERDRFAIVRTEGYDNE